MISIMTADDYTKKQGSSSNYGTDLIIHAFPNLGIKRFQSNSSPAAVSLFTTPNPLTTFWTGKSLLHECHG